jgi:alpha-glucosidase (family GH31 glycosyl hydrolase)
MKNSMKDDMKRSLRRTGLLGSAAILGSMMLAWGAGGRVQSIVPRNGYVEIITDSVKTTITPVTENIFRIASLPTESGESFPKSQAAILPANAKYRVISSSKGIVITTGSTSVEVDRSTGQLRFLDADNELLLAESEGADNKPFQRHISFAGPENEYFYGAGERGHSLRLNGDTLRMYNRQNYGYGAGDPRINQMNITVPYFASDLGYGVLFDDYSKGELVLGDKIEYTSESPSPVAYYFINGNGTLAGTTENYTLLTGRQELPPFWAMGYITSKYGYHTQDEALGVIDTLKTRGYPVDGMVLDLYWYGTETDMGRLEWNKTQWPDHKKMLAELKKKGVNMVIISQPYINKIGAIDNYNMLSDAGMLVKDSEGNTHDVHTWVGDAGMFDVSNPTTREWLWNRYKSLTEDGVAGWWGDLGEPEVHPSTIRHYNGLTAEQYHNVYGNEWSRIIYEGFKKDFPDNRIILLMRGGTAGLQRYSVFPWSTDVARSWAGFQPQVNIMLNSSLSGLAYMSSDIGGFAVDQAHPTNPELYVRWLQMGAFTPTFRTHAQMKPEPYNYPQYESISKRFIKMRYEWLPYNYTLAYENTTEGAPLARPLNFRGDNAEEKYSNINDEYMWGDEVLIAPVMNPGVKSRKVTFPSGKWISWNNPALSYTGGTTQSVKTPINELPIFVKEGSFIPQYTQPVENVTEYDPQFLTIKYFPSKEETAYTLFEDNRISTRSLEDGEYVLAHFSGIRNDGKISIALSAEGGYSEMPEVRMITMEVVGVNKVPKSVAISNGMQMARSSSLKAIRQSGWHYNATTRTLSVIFPWDHKVLSLEINE